LEYEREQREHLLERSRASGLSVELLNTVVPPLTPEEKQAIQGQNDSCRSSYMWKSALSWTGGSLIAVSAGMTISGALATGNSDTTGKIVFGVSAGSLAALGSIFEVTAGIIQQYFSDRGCIVK
jgi:hypothetical protein